MCDVWPEQACNGTDQHLARHAMPAAASLHRGGSLVRCRCRDVSELVLDGAVGNAAVLVKYTRGGIEYLGGFFVEDIADPE